MLAGVLASVASHLVSRIESWDTFSLEIKVIICYQDEITKLVQF